MVDALAVPCRRNLFDAHPWRCASLLAHRMRPRLVTDRPPRAVAYVRVSDEGGRGDNLMSPAIQLAAIRDHCQRRGYELILTLEDIDKSGRFWRRRQIEQAVTMIEVGHADLIVVWKISRVARNRLDWAVAVDRVEGAGGQLESATEPNDSTTSAGRFTRGMMAELAAFESDRIGEGWKETHAARVRAGLSPNGRVPWPWSTVGRAHVADPAGATVIRGLYARYLAGQGFSALAQHLTASGIPTERGARWAASTVKAILDNPIHAGGILYRGEVHPGAHAPIIDDVTWQAYRAQRRDARRARRADTPYLLAGLLICAVCGHALVGQGARPPGRPRYRCGYAAETGAHPAPSVRAELLDAVVLEWLAAEVAVDLDQAIDAQPNQHAGIDRLVIESQVTALDRRLATLTGHLVSGLVPEAAYATARDDIAGQRAALIATLRADDDRQAMTAYAPAAADVLAEWDSLDVLARRAALRALISRVTVAVVDGDVDLTIEPAWRSSPPT